MLNKAFDRLRHSLFFAQVKIMLAGTAIGQMITIAVIPMMARLFTPADLAAYAIVVALSGLSAVGAALRYELTIILPKEDGKADKLFAFCLQSITITTILLFIALLIVASVKDLLPYADKIPELSTLIIFWPLFHFLNSLNSAGCFLLTRKNMFKLLSRAQIIRSSATALGLIVTGFSSMGYQGLLLSTLFGQLAFSYVIWHSNLDNLKKISDKPDFGLLSEYKNFPLYSLPMSLVNVFSIDMLLYFLNFFTTPYFTGLYAKALRVISTPLNIISQAFGNVFFKKLNTSDRRIKIYNLAFIINLLTATILLSPLFFWSEDLFALVLGEPWRNAGRIAKYLLPLTVVRFAAASVSLVYDVLHKNRVELFLHLGYLSISVLLLWFCLEYLELDQYQSIFWFAIWGSVAYFILYLTGLSLLKKDSKQVSSKL